MPTFYQNYLAISNTADVRDGSPSPSDRYLSQYIRKYYRLLRHPWKKEVLFFYFVPDTTWDQIKTKLSVLLYSFFKMKDLKELFSTFLCFLCRCTCILPYISIIYVESMTHKPNFIFITIAGKIIFMNQKLSSERCKNRLTLLASNQTERVQAILTINAFDI
jgi:hypothetical protein